MPNCFKGNVKPNPKQIEIQKDLVLVATYYAQVVVEYCSGF